MPDPFNACQWLLDRHVEAGRGDRLALRCQGVSVTYADLLARSQSAAQGLLSLGVRPEERVLMVMLDSVEFVTTFLGAMRIGAVPSPANPLLPGRDLAVIGADARARVAIVSADKAAVVDELRAGAPELREVVVVGEGSWNDHMTTPADVRPHLTWDESPGFWLCTSGSTGHPKLAMHRHGDLRVTADTYGRHVLGVGEQDVCYSVGPMFHAYGLGNSLTFPLAAGGTSILEPTRPPTPELVADIVKRERPTLFFCIPGFYAALVAADLPRDTFASVRHGISAAEALPAEVWRRFRDRFGVEILDGIGSTEAAHIFISNFPGAVRPGTSGQVVPGYEVRVVDDEGRPAKPEQPGHLLVKGDSLATGYWCQAQWSRRTFQGEWMLTGDTYTASEDGFYTYMGRSDDMLRVSGEWVSPAEVEATLIEHPDVLEVAVVGQPDELGVTRPVAYVVAYPERSLDPDDLIAFSRQRLAGFKCPRRVEVVEALPKTVTGKIQRFRLRA